MKLRLSSQRLATLLVCGVAGLHGSLIAQQVVIVPTTISGTITIGTLPITNYMLYAFPPSGTSTYSSQNPNVPNPSYSTIVGVAETGTTEYRLDMYARTDGNRDTILFNRVSIPVTATTPGTHNFVLDEPGFVEANFTVVGPSPLAHVSLTAYYSVPNVYEQASTSAAAGTNYRFAVIPRSNMTLNGTVSFANGQQRSLASQVISVTPNGTTQVTYTVDGTPPLPPPTPTGSIAGTISFTGSTPVSSHQIYTSGATFKSVNLFAPPQATQFSLEALAPSNFYSIWAYSYFNNGNTYLYHPNASFSPTRYPIAVGSGQTTVDIIAEQAHIAGTLNLTGASSYVPFMNYGYLYARGAGTEATGGTAFDRLTVPGGAYELVVTPGSWRASELYAGFFRSAPYFNGNFYFSDHRSNASVITATAAETTSADVTVAIGEVTITMSVASGTMSNPRVTGSCVQRDATNALLWSSSFYSQSNQTNVTQGSVTFISPGGQCTVTPQVTINGVTLSSPNIAVEVVPGTSQVVDVGGPSLTVTSPLPGYITPYSSITVNGSATDDVAVVSVTVNGSPASVYSANDSNDPARVNFYRSISLTPGPNVITTVATDVSIPVKTTTDTRTVYYDTALPTLAFTPPNGHNTTSSTLTIAGTANDDAGISKITLNGVDVTFTSTGNPSLPKEVSFSRDIPLAIGANTVSVVVTDISTRTTTQQRSYTRLQQVPTTLSVASATGVFGGVTTLSASLTADGSGVSGKTVRFTLNGNSIDAVTDAAGVATASAVSIAGLDAATYSGAIVASFAGDADFLSSTGSGHLTVKKATATLNVGGLSHTYDGTAKSASWSIVPSGLSVVSVTYNGSPAAPTNAGSYAVEVSLSNANYEATPATGALVIAKATPAILVQSLKALFDGSPHPISAAVIGVGGANLGQAAVIYASSPNPPVTPGIYPVVAVFPGDVNYNAVSNNTAVVVIDAEPVIQTVSGPSDPLPLNVSTTVSFDFDDAATADSHTCRFIWGDGQPDTTAALAPGQASCSASHAFSSAGVYVVALTVTDDDGYSAEGSFQYVVVYDPNAGFVTGGGWIDSPADAYIADLNLTGKANFGFVSKYKKGMIVPTGETEFHFQTASFRFKSSVYEWLVVSGARAQYKGSGTINDAGDFGFLLTAVDGQVNGGGGTDRFRIKIWDKASGAVVYDNLLGASDDLSTNPQAIGGGSIVIHAK